ncbi:hypothetical protein D3C78_1856000 [compost metagenome]
MRASGAFKCWYRFSTRLLDTIESPVAKKATRRWIRWRSPGDILLCRSLMSIWKLISSTVQVFLIAFRYMS